MLLAIISVYSLYILLRMYVSVMQIGFVAQAKNQEAVLMPASDYLKAGNYLIAKERMALLGALIEYVLFIFWMGYGLEWVWHTFSGASEVAQAIFTVWTFLAVGMVVSLPLDVYKTFGLDTRFGFNKTTQALFIKDTLITSMITLIASALVVWVVHEIITSSAMWWVYTFIFLMAVIVLVNILFPILRALLFDKLTPLPQGELKTRLEKLFSENGFDTSGLFISDASKRDARLNAYFAGLGSQKRVVLFDTLVEKLTIEELEAVLGHELGHYQNKDILKNIAMTALMLFVTLALFGNLPEEIFAQLHVMPSSGVVMILFLLLSPVLFFILMPLMGRLSRHNEFRADAMGARLGGVENLVSALKKLVTENRAFPRSHPLYLFFYATHPPVLERLKEMGADVGSIDTSAMEGECPTL